MTGETIYWERWWIIAAGLCLIVAAAALVWRWNLDVAFVAATLGIVCWFLSLRHRMKKSIIEPEIDEEEDAGERDEN